ncbi:unnamed protein product, partial [marine sediment metagenome]
GDIQMNCQYCGKTINNTNPRLCEHCHTYNPTPEQKKRMHEATIKVNKALSKVFK